MNNNLIILLSSLLIRCRLSTPIYRDCLEALFFNSYNTSTYNIQPIANGNIAEVKCSFLNGDIIEMEIGNDVQQNVKLKSSTKKIININYSTLTYEELRELIQFSKNCSQEMALQAVEASPKSYSFQFLDGTNHLLNSAKDGICKCIITQPCETNAANSCPMSGNLDYNKNFNLNGKLAVLSERLPLIRTSYGDLNDPGEWAKHTIQPLKCHNEMHNKIKLLLTAKCSMDIGVLVDRNKETCLKLDQSSIYLSYYSNKIIKIVSSSDKNLMVTVYSKLENGGILVCKQDENNLHFNCGERANRLLTIHIYAKTLISICEIEE
ncbi:unnamed protein product [Dimorphilus gyrociliatus]|uniref:Uncharacterized protein n=1 Tax=Dimorphilus gyrociliatus TaxID=2664684 RepID=A0A7I8WF25_9ANNE|nr:unnamed protein product [Dimorphilus gyrociliatus]